ncbi:hypothetical protein LTR84_001727 [Exophiala bonariae]|uniref:Nephrocystin 3-like N-terminal domain-containing protein n=1 Tax=Exophiala bonariae TaxID=1690606 RepID=A0AAV9NDV3_9EURO|nr:hypothetical protein LTR84_001727 [Exophiala bonariae]
MAEPLSLIASLIAVAQISGEIISLCYNYRSGIKGADANVTRLTSEVKSVRDIIENLIKVVDEQPPQDSQVEAIASLATPGGPLTQALDELQQLEIKLRPASGWRAVGKLLKWPLSEPEVVKTLDRINRLNTTLALAASTDHLKIAIAHRAETKAIKDDTSALLQHQDSTQDKKDRKTIFQWLNAPNAETNLIVARSKRCASTGGWILNDPNYQRWLDTPQSLLWVSGIPGGGKTILCASMIEDIVAKNPQSPRTATVYFFVDSNDHTKRNVLGFLKSVLLQLAATSLTVYWKLKSYHDELADKQSHQQASPPTEDRLLEIFKDSIMCYQTFYLIIDALDESSAVEDFLHMVKSLREINHTQIWQLVTSRPTGIITSAMESISPVNISLDSAVVQVDIETYVERSVTTMAHSKKWPSNLSSEVRTELTNRACGMFRWVDCQLESLRKLHKPLAVRKSLRSIPATLDETYERSVETVPDDNLEDAQILLEWILASFRPLRLNEVSEVLAFDWEIPPHFHHSYRLPNLSDVFSICGDFFIALVNEDKDQLSIGVGFAHSSVRDFLLSERRQQCQSRLALCLPDAHTCMAKICLTYLLTITDRITDPIKLNADFPLSEYAARYWVDHYHAASDKTSLVPLVVSLLDGRRKSNLINCLQLCENDKRWEWQQDSDETASPIYYASLMGLAEVVTHMLQSGESPNEFLRWYNPPLSAAVSSGYLPIVKLLLESGADPNLWHEFHGTTALIKSAEHGRDDIVRALLYHGTKVAAAVPLLNTALTEAVQRGHLGTVRLLLDAGANPLHGNGVVFYQMMREGHTAIYQLLMERIPRDRRPVSLYSDMAVRAIRSGHPAITQLLFENGAVATEKTLWAAAFVGNIELVRELLRQGIDAAGIEEFRPLQEAAGSGSLEVLEELLATGVDVNAHDEYGSTALAAAATHGHVSIVQKLVDRGAIDNVSHGYSNTALHYAALGGETSIVETLLQYGQLTNVYGTVTGHSSANLFTLVLHDACQSEKIPLVQMMLDRGADVNAISEEYLSPISTALGCRNRDLVELLLNHGASANGSDEEWDSPLIGAVYTGILEIVKLLLNRGADISDEVKSGALLKAVDRGEVKMITPLLKSLDQNSKSYSQMEIRALEEAIFRPPRHRRQQPVFAECVKVFLDHGIDPNTRFIGLGRESATGLDRESKPKHAIHHAAWHGNIKTIQTLAAAGADIDAKTAEGLTALHEASRTGDFRLIMALVDDMGADPRPKLIDGNEPIHLAAQEGREIAVRVLIERGADVNVLNGRGLSPLHMAADNAKWEAVQTLLWFGADPRLETYEARSTPLELAETLLLGPSLEPNYDGSSEIWEFKVQKTIQVLKKHMSAE